MGIVVKWRQVFDRIAKHKEQKKEPETRLINVQNFVKEMLEGTNAILDEPEQEENGTWNVEVSEYTYRLLMRHRLGVDRKP